MMDDKALRRTLIDVLDGEPSINAAQIGVAVENGIVTLTGWVKSPAEKVTAEQAIRRVKGVRAVVPNLAICGAGKKALDDEIARRARVVIAWHALVPDGAVRVQVENGWVMLTGTVEEGYERKEAEAAVRKLDDVAGVTNLIETGTATQEPGTDRQIEEMFKQQAEADAIRLTIGNDNGTLRGTMPVAHPASFLERAAGWFRA
jgi:osmotically-inducible protein OsmY